MTTSPELQARLALAANRGDLDECHRLLAASASPMASAMRFRQIRKERTRCRVQGPVSPTDIAE